MTRKKGGRFDYAKVSPVELADPASTSAPAPSPPVDPVLPEKTGVLAFPVVTASPATGNAALQDPSAFALPAQRKGRREDDGTLKRTDVPREQLNIRIRPELKRAAAGLAGLQGKTLGDVVEAALIEYIKASQARE